MLHLIALLTAHAASADLLVDQAIGRIESGDYAGALILLDESERNDGADPDRIHYLRGVALELNGDPAAALALYDDGLERWPDSPLVDDRTFRAAEATATLGHPRQALRRLRHIDADALDPTDRLKLELVQGIARVAAGQERRGLEQLGAALDDATPDQAAFYQAKARITWASVLLDEAERMRLRGREKKVVRRLTARAEHVAAIEAQVTSAAHLQEPEWVLAGLLLLGEAYAETAQAMLDSPTPGRLTDDQAQIYEEVLHERALTVFTKGSRHYGSGLELAARLGWQSRRVGELENAKQQLDARIEAIDPG